VTSRTLRPVALLAALVLVLAACGRPEEGAGGDGGGEPVGSPIPTGPVSGEIDVWAMGTEGENLDVLADEYMAENPDVTVNVTAVPWEAANQRIANAITAGEVPDVSLIGTTWMGQFAQTGGLEPTPSNFDPAAFFEGAWNTTVVDGVSYGVPWYVETRLIYYRTDLAEEAGATVPPGTWDELKQLAQGMQEAGAEWGISLQPGGTGAWQTFMPFAWQNGADITDESGNFTLDSPEVVEALEYYRSFFEEGLSPTALEPGALETGFVEGTIGAFISGPWHIGILNDQGAEEGTWNVAHMPTEEAGTSFVGGGDLVVFKDSDNKEAAWSFVEYLSRPEVQVTWYETVNDLPAVRSAWEDEALSGDEFLSVFGEQLDDAKSPPAIATWEEIASVIDTQIERATIGDASPEEAAQAMQEEASSVGTGQ
jgi:multiple sugar transport system substrate-binding protein